MSTVLFVWDFDRSLVDLDSDEWLLRVGDDVRAWFEAQPREGRSWTQRIDALLGQLAERGESVHSLALHLAALPLLPEVAALIRRLHAAGVEQRIASDANSFAIDCVLNAHNLRSCFAAVHTNPARVERPAAAGLGVCRLRVDPFHPLSATPHGCTHCPANMCKGALVQRVLRDEAFERIFYVGDGHNDYCPARRLRAGSDRVFARSGHRLAALIAATPIAAPVSPWATGADLAAAIGAFFPPSPSPFLQLPLLTSPQSPPSPSLSEPPSPSPPAPPSPSPPAPRLGAVGLLRHAQSLPNVRGVVVSDLDAGVLAENGLSELGRTQAVDAVAQLFSSDGAVHARLHAAPALVFVASPFSRASETARLFRAELAARLNSAACARSAACEQCAAGVRVVPALVHHAALRERHFGAHNLGAASAYDQVWERDAQDDNHTDAGVESAAAVRQRVSDLCAVLAEAYGQHGAVVLLVSHGDPLDIFYAAQRGERRVAPGFANAEFRWLN